MLLHYEFQEKDLIYRVTKKEWNIDGLHCEGLRVHYWENQTGLVGWFVLCGCFCCVCFILTVCLFVFRGRHFWFVFSIPEA